MSNWIFDRLRRGETFDIQGPNGECFYLAGEPQRPLLLVGNGSGLAPLIGIAREALAHRQRAPIRLYHGSRHASGLYLRDELRLISRTFVSNRQQMFDAKLRETMISTYLALIANPRNPVGADERVLVLQAIFRPAGADDDSDTAPSNLFDLMRDVRRQGGQ